MLLQLLVSSGQLLEQRKLELGLGELLAGPLPPQVRVLVLLPLLLGPNRIGRPCKRPPIYMLRQCPQIFHAHGQILRAADGRGLYAQPPCVAYLP